IIGAVGAGIVHQVGWVRGEQPRQPSPSPHPLPAWNHPRANGAPLLAAPARPETSYRSGYKDISWDLLLLVAVGTANDLTRRCRLAGDQPKLAGGRLPFFLQLRGAVDLRTRVRCSVDRRRDNASVERQAGQQLLQCVAPGANLTEQRLELRRVGFGHVPDWIERSQ